MVRPGHGADGPAVWVLDDAAAPASDACIAIAERLGTSCQRIRLQWDWRGAIGASAPGGSLLGLMTPLPLLLPGLTLSAGRRAGAVATWLRRRGSVSVRVGAAGHDGMVGLRIRDGSGLDDAHTAHVLGLPHRTSALTLLAAGAVWRDRLDHLPRPLLTVLLGSGGFRPADAHGLARRLAAAVGGNGGAILAAVASGTSPHVADAFQAGLSGSLNSLHRAGEPGSDPTDGMLALADAIVVAGHAPELLLRACATAAPVYVLPGDKVPSSLRRRLARLVAAGQVRILDDAIEAWTRTPLDEADRIAGIIHARYRIACGQSADGVVLARTGPPQ